MTVYRCRQWQFKLQFKLLVKFELKYINFLQDTLKDIMSDINGQKKIQRVFELIMGIGYYLNYRSKNRQVEGAQGSRLDIFDKLRSCKANKPTTEQELKRGYHPVPDMGCKDQENEYSLLMFLVDHIQRKHPELADWVKVFDKTKKCSRIEMDKLQGGVKKIQAQVAELKKDLDAIEKEEQQRLRPKRGRKGKRKKKKKEETKEKEEEKEQKADPEETWEPPPAPPDVYRSVMIPFLKNAEKEANELMSNFRETKEQCLALVAMMGIKCDDKDDGEYPLGHPEKGFWRHLLFDKAKKFKHSGPCLSLCDGRPSAEEKSNWCLKTRKNRRRMF